MDEPLSNLDAKLRVEMRNAIKRIQQQVGITTLYVTHDQEEALAVSDRIAVMNGASSSRLTPQRTSTSGPANIFRIHLHRTVQHHGRNHRHVPGRLHGPGSGITQLPWITWMQRFQDGQPVKVSVRPEEFIISRGQRQGIPAIVRSSVFLGSPPIILWSQRTAGRWRSYRTPISGISSGPHPGAPGRTAGQNQRV